MIYSKVSKNFALSAMLVVFAFGAIAQQQVPSTSQEVKEDFTDEELETFVKINQEVIPIQQDAEGEMMDAISQKGMEVTRFQEFAQAQQTGKITDVSEDPEEIAKFNEAGQEVMKVQERVQGEIQQKIKDYNMDIQTFQQISMAYNQSEKIKNKIDKMLEDGEGNPQ
jgi:hypothetical protein